MGSGGGGRGEVKGEPEVTDSVKLCVTQGSTVLVTAVPGTGWGSDEVGEFASLGKTHGGARTSEAAERGPG